MWLFFFTYALLAVVYVTHVIRIDFLTPFVCNLSKLTLSSSCREMGDYPEDIR
jgi:hypothetical protein